MFKAVVEAIVAAETGNLKELLAIVGGDRRSFYSGADLSGVDVRGQDLVGLNFQGSYLDKAIFDSGTRWDKSATFRQLAGMDVRADGSSLRLYPLAVLDLKEVRTTVINIAVAAGAIVMEGYRSRPATTDKSDGSVVTEYDKLSESAIRQQLLLRFPEIPIVAEEARAEFKSPIAVGRRFFLVDPLDGTRDFAEGRATFTVNIALIEDGRPVFGLIYVPALHDLYSGLDGEAVKYEVKGGEARVLGPLSVSHRSKDFRLIASRLRSDTDKMKKFRAELAEQSFDTVGSSQKFCEIASGGKDIYPCLGETFEWDTAAGEAIVEAAGGTVITATGPLNYGKRNFQQQNDFGNPDFVVYGGTDGGCIEKLRTALANLSVAAV